MDPEKDVLDGWCMYMEKSTGSGSNSSDSESIEIISEDEAGNYQIYSKNYFKPEIVKSDSIQSNIKKDKENIPIISEIKEYCENDPTQFLVEEGKEAQEKEHKDRSTKDTKKKNSNESLQPEDNFEKDKVTKKIVEKTSQGTGRTQASENSIEEIQNKKLSQNQGKNTSTIENSSDKISRESQIESKSYSLVESLSVEKCEFSSNTTMSDNAIKRKETNNIVSEDNERDVKVNAASIGLEITNDGLDSEQEEQCEFSSNTTMSDNAIKRKETNNIVTEDSERDVKVNAASIGLEITNDGLASEQEVSNFLFEKIDENLLNYSAARLRETCEKISFLDVGEVSTTSSSTIQQQQTNISLLDSPSPSTTHDNRPTSTTLPDENIVLSNPSCVKKVRIENQLPDTVETFSRESEKHVPLDTPPVTALEEVSPSCQPIGVRKARKRLISGKKAVNKVVEESCSTRCSVKELKLAEDLHLTSSRNPSLSNSIIATPVSTRTPQDISTLVLISVVSSVIYLIFSTLVFPNSNIIVPQNGVRTEEDNPVSVHDRYFQLVADWEAKVLENAELDYRIALKEKTEKLYSASRQPSAAPVSLPDCMASHVLNHAFVHLRQYPPDIADLPSWSKTKLCVDLRLLLTPMRAASFSAVLKLLTFLASPSSALDYQAVFEHYLSQQKMHIQHVIQRDYPEIYRSNAFHRPQERLRPHMYCVSMQRLSILKLRFAPGQDDLSALLRLGELHVQREACLQATVQGDGRAVDRLYNFALDVLLSRSISTAITLDPSLLHDYYLELTLSNDANLKKLSRQLFKYNVLAIQKFNLSVEVSNVESNQAYKYENGVQQERKNLHRSYNEKVKKDEFLMVRDGDDDFLLLNKKFDEDLKDQQKKTKIKLVSLSKKKVELFYDSQLREISNGYSSKVRKFLSDINKDLKHALCHPYANDAEDSGPGSGRDKSLVRFIRTMCRTNVFNTAPDNVEEPHEIPIVTPVQFSQVVHDRSLQVENKSYTFDINNNVFSKEIPMSLEDIIPIENYSMIHENEFLNTKNKPEIVHHREDDYVEIELADFEIEDEKEYHQPPQYKVYDKEIKRKVLLDPESHIYSKSDFQDKILLIPEEQAGYNFSSKDKKHFVDPTGNILSKEQDELQQNVPERDYGNVEESLRNEKNYNMPDLWILNKMANSFGLNNIEKEPLIDPYNVETLDEDIPNKIYQTDKTNKRHKSETHGQMDSFFDEFHHDSKKSRKRKQHPDQLNKHDDKGERRDRKYKVNAYDTIRDGGSRRSGEEKRDDRPNKRRGSHTDRVNAYDSRPRLEQRRNVYNSRSGKASRSCQEERIVHIDGHDNRYTRHVYIDDAARESEMDWWLNRRARLRAELRKKHVYPKQDNHEHQWDFLYE